LKWKGLSLIPINPKFIEEMIQLLLKPASGGLTSTTFGGREFKGKYLHALKSYFGKSKTAAFLKRMLENHYVTILGSGRGTKYKL